MTVPFRDRFSAGLFVTYDVCDFELLDGMVALSSVIEHMDNEAKFMLVPDPSDELIAKHYEQVQSGIGSSGRTFRMMTPEEFYSEFPSPFPDRDTQVLPEPIWTNVTVSGEDRPEFVIFTRVYGGILKDEYAMDDDLLPEDAVFLQAVAAPDAFPTPFGWVAL